MAIDVTAISITGAFNAIKSYFQSQENNSKWKDLTSGAEGNFLMRMLSNVFRNISQNTITGRREVFHDTANLLSSNIGMAVNNGYPVFRGRNQRRLINFTPNDNMTIPKFTMLGTYSGDVGIYTLEDLTFVQDVPMEFSVVIGELREVQWNANTNALKKFIRFEQNISEDVDLLVDGTSMSAENALTKYKREMIYDKYYIYTNPWKSVTIEYRNNAANAQHKYDSDTVFTLRYIQLEDVDNIEFENNMFSNYGTLNNVLTIENYIPFESVESIKFNSPIYRETQNLVRSKADFADMVRELTPSIFQTKFLPLTPTYTAVTYLKNDFTLLEQTEYNNTMAQLEPCMGFGRPLPDIVDPVKEVTTLDIILGVTNRYTDEASITQDVQSITDANYANQLNITFDKYDLENFLNKLTYAKYARVDLHLENREPYVQKKIGDMITANDMNYVCTGILGTAGINEPDWNIPSIEDEVISIYTGLETVDNNLVWACYKRLDVTGLQPWKASKKFMIGDYVYSEAIPQYMFKCVDVIHYSGVQPPDVVGIEVGDYLMDGTMELICITYNPSYPDRANNTAYRLGDKFNYNGLSFEYIGMTGYTSSDEVLTFNDANYELFAFSDEDFEDAYRLDGNQVCLYIADTAVANMVNPGDVLRINTVESVEKLWEEVPADQLVMKSQITEEVKEYTDETDTSGEETGGDKGGDTGTSVTVDVGDFYSGNTIPDISTVEMNDSITDGELTLTRVPYDETYPQRIGAAPYRNNDHFTITTYTDDEGTIQDQKSFVINTPVNTETVTNPGTGEGSEEEPKPEPTPDPNAGWKELEKYKALQDDVQAWIESEDADKLHCPSDVIQFFYEIGRIDTDERDKLTQYYVQYDEPDEEQIYLYMDQMNASRLDAIAMMTRQDVGHEHCYQLKDPISDADCVRYYDINDETKLIYIDRYSESNNGFTVTRTDNSGVVRAVRTYIYQGNNIVLQEEKINNDSESVSKIYLMTAQYADNPRRNVNGRVTQLTRIVPTTAINRYTAGYVDISFTKTDDGDIRWEQLNDIEKRIYNWNTFTNFDINLTIRY